MTTLPLASGVDPARPAGRAGASVVTDAHVMVAHRPVLDVARGTVAGYQAVADVSGDGAVDRLAVTVTTIDAALTASSTLPPNTFISVPVPHDLAGDRSVCARLHAHGSLAGVVLDVTDFSSGRAPAAEVALEGYRRAGARIAVGGADDAQPELGSIVRLRPAIIRLGAAWTHGIDTNPSRRNAIEVTGRLAGQLDAWILADAVASAGELRVLAQLGVPLARGPFVGVAGAAWPPIAIDARKALPPSSVVADGVLRTLLQQAYTTHDAESARAVLPRTSGFDSVVVVDESRRPVSLLQPGPFGGWDAVDVLTVNVDTPVADAVGRAMARPTTSRFTPLTCTDAAGRFVGVLRIERLLTHLADESTAPRHLEATMTTS